MTSPAVTGVNPQAGRGGTSVSISGSGFTGATAVAFGSLLDAASFTVVSDTHIDAVSPASVSGLSGVVDITVTTPAGTSTASTADLFNLQPPITPPFVCYISYATPTDLGSITGAFYLSGQPAVSAAATIVDSNNVVLFGAGGPLPILRLSFGDDLITFRKRAESELLQNLLGASPPEFGFSSALVNAVPGLTADNISFVWF
jgi:hypothetical protein